MQSFTSSPAATEVAEISFPESSPLQQETFAQDVLEGLSAYPKRLSSKYFYDEKGDKIFQAIMEMPSYYLTRSEYEILETYKGELHQLFSQGNKHFNLIEFGAGDGLKTKLLLKHFSRQNTPFRYLPIDISGHVLRELEQSVKQELPMVSIEPLQDDYFRALHRLDQTREGRNVVLFLGSNIGNFTEKEAIDFLKKMGQHLHPGDLVLIGFDLKKDPALINAAYNDPFGITRAFNFNLLSRMNRELDANFDLDKFQHYPHYDPVSGEARSYLISTKEQNVFIGFLQQSFSFKAWEPIHVEISRKYDQSTIQKYAEKAGFNIQKLFYDSKNLYVDALWEKI